MNKDELIKLKEKLERNRVERYYRVIIEGIDNEKNVRFHLFNEPSRSVYPKSTIDSEYSIDNEQNVVNYIENSLETIIRSADSKEMDYDTLSVDFTVTLYISAKMFEKSTVNDMARGPFARNDPDTRYRLLSIQDFDINEIFHNIDVLPIFSGNMNEPVRNMLKQGPRFKQVNYDKLALLLNERGFTPTAENMGELINLLLKGKNLSFDINFAKENDRSK